MPVEPRERVGLYKVSSRDLLDVYGDARTNDKDDRTVCRIKRSGDCFGILATVFVVSTDEFL